MQILFVICFVFHLTTISISTDMFAAIFLQTFCIIYAYRILLQVAALFSIKIKQTKNCSGYAFCQTEIEIPISEVTQIGQYEICYQIPLQHYSFKDPKEVLVVTANSRGLPDILMTRDERRLAIYLSGHNISRLNELIYSNGYLSSTSFALDSYFTVAISSVHQSMVSLGKCNPSKTYENCLSECRVSLFQQLCNCTPTTWSSWASLELYKECRLSNYIHCATYTGYDDAQCMKEQCGTLGDLCERRIFELALVKGDPSLTGARLVLQVGSLDYPVFEEQYRYTLEEFIGVLGGAIGFYLGLDFLGILLIIAKIIASLASWYSMLKKPEPY